jgi:hypothetical protein
MDTLLVASYRQCEMRGILKDFFLYFWTKEYEQVEKKAKRNMGLFMYLIVEIKLPKDFQFVSTAFVEMQSNQRSV